MTIPYDLVRDVAAMTRGYWAGTCGDRYAALDDRYTRALRDVPNEMTIHFIDMFDAILSPAGFYPDAGDDLIADVIERLGWEVQR